MNVLDFLAAIAKCLCVKTFQDGSKAQEDSLVFKGAFVGCSDFSQISCWEKPMENFILTLILIIYKKL